MAREETTEMASTISLDLHSDKEYEIVAGQPEEKLWGEHDMAESGTSDCAPGRPR